MQIAIPEQAQGLLKQQAFAAGYEDVSDYVVSLVLQDRESRRQLEAFANDDRMEALAIEGLDSGPAVPLDMDAIRHELLARLRKP
jgi:Arc/MetJ-type ribon-helix-helix transcriptional regulator